MVDRSRFPSTSGYKSTFSGWEATMGYRAYCSSAKDEQRARIMSKIDEILSDPSGTSSWKVKSAKISELIEHTYGKDDQEDKGHSTSVLDEFINRLKKVIEKNTSENYSLEDQAAEITELLKTVPVEDHQVDAMGKILAVLKEMVLKEILSTELLGRILHSPQLHAWCLARYFQEIAALREQGTEVIDLLNKILTTLEPRQSTNSQIAIGVSQAERKPWWTTKRFVSLRKLALEEVLKQDPKNEYLLMLSTLTQTLDREDYERIADSGMKVSADGVDFAKAAAGSGSLEKTVGSGKKRLENMKLMLKKMHQALMEKLRSIGNTKAFMIARVVAVALFVLWAQRYIVYLFNFLFGGGN